jgi:hypothetical protein
MTPRMTSWAALVATVAACARAPEPAVIAPRAAHAQPAARAETIPARPTVERALDEHQRAAAPEQKPTTGAHLAIAITQAAGDDVLVTVTVSAQRALPRSTLRFGTELSARFEAEAEWRLDALAEGATIVRSARLRRTVPGPHGVFVTASVTADVNGESITDSESAWAFGGADPARVLPRSGAELGPDGVGVLGPNERVIRTPSGERLHETVLP